MDNQVDFYAVSFVKDERVVHELKDYLRSNFFFFKFSFLRSFLFIIIFWGILTLHTVSDSNYFKPLL